MRIRLAHLIVLVAIAGLASCVTPQGQYLKNPFKVIVTESQPDLYQNQGGYVGHNIGTGPYRIGDTLLIMGWAGGGFLGPAVGYYLVDDQSRGPAWLERSSTASLDGFAAAMQGTTATVHRRDGNDAWGRMVVWMSENSRLGLRLANDYILETFVPNDSTATGYMATRFAMNDSVTIRLSCLGAIRDPRTNQWQRVNRECIRTQVLAAYFVRSGKRLESWEIPRFLIRASDRDLRP